MVLDVNSVVVMLIIAVSLETWIAPPVVPELEVNAEPLIETVVSIASIAPAPAVDVFKLNIESTMVKGEAV